MIRTVITLLLLVVAGCIVAPRQPGPGQPVAWQELEGWDTGRQSAAWPALVRSCSKIGTQPQWRDVCNAIEAVQNPSDAEAKRIIETHLQPRPVYNENGGRDGLITGYYEPLLNGSFERSERYRYPLYAPPDDLLTIDLGDVYPETANRQLRGRLGRNNKIVPYADRAEIEAWPAPLSDSVLIWVDDPFDLFFLHVQGSGHILLPDGNTVAAGFANHNGHPYRSIGARLIEMGELKREDVTLFSIRDWLRSNPREARVLLHHNPRFVFFQLRENTNGPRGALGVPLSAEHSIAVDAEKIPLGAPMWLETSEPGEPGISLNRLMVAQDTGAAIKGYTRADVFWGQGHQAERKAGTMKQSGRIFLLLPKND